MKIGSTRISTARQGASNTAIRWINSRSGVFLSLVSICMEISAVIPVAVVACRITLPSGSLILNLHRIYSDQIVVSFPKARASEQTSHISKIAQTAWQRRLQFQHLRSKMDQNQRKERAREREKSSHSTHLRFIAAHTHIHHHLN